MIRMCLYFSETAACCSNLGLWFFCCWTKSVQVISLHWLCLCPLSLISHQSINQRYSVRAPPLENIIVFCQRSKCIIAAEIFHNGSKKVDINICTNVPFKVEWLKQQVVQRRVKRISRAGHISPIPMRRELLPATHHQSSDHMQDFGDPVWNRLWYIVSQIVLFCFPLPCSSLKHRHKHTQTQTDRQSLK